MMANLMKLRQKKQKVDTGLLRDKLYEQDFAGLLSLRASKVLGPISRYRVVDILLHMNMYLLVLGSLLAFFAFSATGYAWLKDFTLRMMNKCVVLDARMNPTLSPTTTNSLACMICLDLFGDRLLSFRGEAIFSMTCSPR